MPKCFKFTYMPKMTTGTLHSSLGTCQKDLKLTLNFIFYSMDKLAMSFFICSTNKLVEEEEVIITLSQN
jgi:hypothetical protein